MSARKKAGSDWRNAVEIREYGQTRGHKAGSDIYVPTLLDMSRLDRDFSGGLCRIADIKEKLFGEIKWRGRWLEEAQYAELEGRQGYYLLTWLMENDNQRKLKAHFKDKRDCRLPDEGDIVIKIDKSVSPYTYGVIDRVFTLNKYEHCPTLVYRGSPIDGHYLLCSEEAVCSNQGVLGIAHSIKEANSVLEVMANEYVEEIKSGIREKLKHKAAIEVTTKVKKRIIYEPASEMWSNHYITSI